MTTTTKTNHYLKALAAITVSAIAAGSLLIATEKPAEAAFPGENGKIVFTSKRVTTTNPEGDSEIFTMNPDGTNLKQLTRNDASDLFPSFSPDGKRTAFTSARSSGSFEVYTMKASGKKQKRLTKNQDYDGSPTWSPDGKQIAFVSSRDGNFEVYTMNRDGSKPTNRSNNAASDGNPAWSPGGGFIAFDSDREGNYDVYTMAISGAPNPSDLQHRNRRVSRLVSRRPADSFRDQPGWAVQPGGGFRGLYDEPRRHGPDQPHRQHDFVRWGSRLRTRRRRDRLHE